MARSGRWAGSFQAMGFGSLGRKFAHQSRYKVSGASMLPSFAPGSVVSVSKPGTISVGDVVILDCDGLNVTVTSEGHCSLQSLNGFAMKRVAALPGSPIPLGFNGDFSLGLGLCLVLGDNLSESCDSRHFGAVKLSQIVGIVIRRGD